MRPALTALLAFRRRWRLSLLALALVRCPAAARLDMETAAAIAAALIGLAVVVNLTHTHPDHGGPDGDDH